MQLAAVVLAAGGGSRFEGPVPKLLVPIAGEPMVVGAVRAALGAGLDETIVVSGAVDLAPVLAAAGLADRVTLLVNGRWAEGQATSLAVAVAAADVAGHDAVVVGLGDQPGVGTEAWRLVAEADPGAPIVVATYGARRRNPVRLGRQIWPELPVEGDEGARVLLRRRPDLVAEVGCPGEPDDVDTLEDLERWS
ncbi:MAG: nucleotidyltransferase family protein [Acidimicrobiales bacterium]